MTAEQAETELIQHHGWTAGTLRVWVRAQGRCEYCDVELLASASVYFHGAHVDHIVPGAGEDLENLALSCTACNRMKRRTKFLVAGETLPERKALIERARYHIGKLRARDEDRRKLALSLLFGCGITERPV